MRIELGKGLDIPVAGRPEPVIEAGNPVRSVALLGGDYAGLRPGMRVQVGDRVGLGQPLFVDKRDPDVQYTSPGSGVVTGVNRGARRALQSVVVELDDTADDSAPFPVPATPDPDALSPDAIRAGLHASGLWTALRTRPFDRVPRADGVPRSIFVTAIDTRPLAADPAPIVAAQRDAFAFGLRVLSRLTAGPVWLCVAPGWNGPRGDGERIRPVEFAGPHPAGLPGTHIHHLDPVGPDRTVWHIGYQDVIAIGLLFNEGRLHVGRTVALGGEGFDRPRLVTTRMGANVAELTAGALREADHERHPPRLIAGSLLNGRIAAGPAGFLGRYHAQVCALPQDNRRRLFGWFSGLGRAYSFAGPFSRRRRQRHSVRFTSARLGRKTALVPVDAFEKILPLDILPVPLLRALLVGDTDQAQALGCLELAAEDLALMSFVCPGKLDYGRALRINLEQIEREG